jgi:hypothetical protein
MKKLFLLTAIIFTAQFLKAQVISGLYSGTLINDSSNKVQQYELALSEYRDKVTGYSYTTFIVNDTFYYSVKRIKGEKKGSELIVEDDKMLANNFPESPAKGVKQTNIIPLPAEDTMRTFNGKWKTNQTKIYYSLYGGVEASRNNDSSQSALINHLKELKLAGGHSYGTNPKEATATTRKGAGKAVVNNSEASKAEAALPYTLRANKVLQTLTAKEDSLALSFYDNGVVDGDVISVYVNNKNIILNASLTVSAIKKTISLKEFTDSEVQLTLVAENLGSLPPNTGLLVVQLGNQRYDIRFSADLKTNASIIFRK